LFLVCESRQSSAIVMLQLLVRCLKVELENKRIVYSVELPCHEL